MQVYSLDEKGIRYESFREVEIDWNCAFICSTIRAMYPLHQEYCIYKKPIPTSAEFNKFLEAVAYAIEKNFSFGKITEKALWGSNYLVYKVTQYLAQRMRYEECIMMLEKLINFETSFYGLLSYILSLCGEIKQSVKLLTEIIKKNPDNENLLYHQALGLMKLGYDEFALKLAKLACELSPDSCESWILLAELYYKTGELNYVLINRH